MEAKDFVTREDICKQAEADFDAAFAKPIPPTPITLGRPVVMQVEDAHIWVDMSVSSESYNTPRSPHAAIFMVQRDNGKDQRIQGKLETEDIDIFIAELQRVKAEIVEKKTYLDLDSEHRKELQAWESKKQEFVRIHAQNWDRLRSKK